MCVECHVSHNTDVTEVKYPEIKRQLKEKWVNFGSQFLDADINGKEVIEPGAWRQLVMLHFQSGGRG